MANRLRTAPELRFWPKVNQTETCWLWTGGTNGKYGTFFAAPIGKSRVYAHRWSYEHFVGPIPAGLQIDHLCRQPLCVRPDHLEPVTARENMRRGSKASQTHCQRGHAFDEANTRIKTNGTRECRRCALARQRKRNGFQGLGRQTRCVNGHEFTPKNTYIKRTSGTRACRACWTVRARRYSKAKRAS